MYVYIYIYTYIHTYIHIYIYIHTYIHIQNSMLDHVILYWLTLRSSRLLGSWTISYSIICIYTYISTGIIVLHYYISTGSLLLSISY